MARPDLKALRALCLFFATATALSAAEPLSVFSIPSDTAFEILDVTNVRVIAGRTPAVVKDPPEGRYQIIFRRPGCSPLRFWMDPEKSARDVMANFTLLEQWRDLNAEKRQAVAAIQGAQVLANQVGPALLNDLGTIVRDRRNTRILTLLNQYGVQVNDLKGGLKNHTPKPSPKPSPTPAPATNPAPAPPPDTGEDAHLYPVLEWNEKMIEEWSGKVEKLRAEVEKLRTMRSDAVAVQGHYERLMNDLLELAESDADTQGIVKKWQIKRDKGDKAPAK